MKFSGRNPFKIKREPAPSPVSGRPVTVPDAAVAPIEQVEELVGSAEVFLFIKGTPEQPMCGFSANTVAVMNSTGAAYRTFDILSDEGVRAAAKQYAGWPTFPQVYVGGEFVGGNDIITEMAGTGELVELLQGQGS